ncbi:MAG: glycosyltransferase, partial [Candidatus Pacebacteria bacterium]|nr:glycosyltransferase [Candidatus Paceibacterota bacterium]
YRVKAILTPTGINLENIKNLRKINKNSDLRIGFFGQYSYNKSPLDLLDCFLELSPVNAELFMAAENINLFKEKFLYKKVKGNNNIIMKGYLDDIYSYINSCDIVVVPFISDYGVLGLDQTVIDSMSLGKVVIGYSSVTIRPLIAHGDDGFLYKNKDELKRYLNILIRNPTLRKSMGTKAQKKIMTYYNIDKTVEKIYRIFRTFQRN